MRLFHWSNPVYLVPRVVKFHETGKMKCFLKFLNRVLSRLYYFENGNENENITKNITDGSILLEFMRILLFWLVKSIKQWK